MPSEIDEPGAWAVWRKPVTVLGAITASVGLIVAVAVGALSAHDPEPTTAAVPPAAATAPGPPSPDATEVSDLPTAAPVATPSPSTGIITTTVAIAFPTRTVRDRSLPKGTRTIRRTGVPGLRRLTYRVTYVDGKPRAGKLVSSVVATRPVTEVVAVGTRKPKPKR